MSCYVLNTFYKILQVDTLHIHFNNKYMNDTNINSFYSDLGSGIVDAFSSVLNVIAILLIGWVIAILLQGLLVKLLTISKSDKLLQFEPIKNFVNNTGKKVSVPKFVGNLFYWIILLLTFSAAAEVSGIQVLSDLVTNLLNYLPNLFIGIIMLLAVLVLANFVYNFVLTISKGSGMAKYSKILSNLARVAVLVFGILVAVQQLNIDVSLITENLTILVAAVAFSVALAAGLAFGLGGREKASKYLDEWLK